MGSESKHLNNTSSQSCINLFNFKRKKSNKQVFEQHGMSADKTPQL